MKIKRLLIQNFRNFKSLELIISDNTCVLIGNNGTGKSNLLEAISGVFAFLFDPKRVPEFRFILEYEIKGKRIFIKKLSDSIEMQIGDQNVETLTHEHLPSKIICLYSGEELRLWNSHYEHFYRDYLEKTIANKPATLNMQMINSAYWEIALISLFLFDQSIFTDIKDFFHTLFGDASIRGVEFKFDVSIMKKWSENRNRVFLQKINPTYEKSVNISIDNLMKSLDSFADIRDFHQLIAPAYLAGTTSRIITSIDATFSNGLNMRFLSEGEKRLILIKFILEVVADQDSLILMDEPDSHIHVSRKRELEQIINNYKDKRNSIITTHSPTLTHCFADQTIRLLTKTKAGVIKIDKEGSKRKAIKELTNGIWSYDETAIFLSTEKDILLVEGKTDVTYISTALKKLQICGDYKELSFEIFPFGGASNLKEIIEKFEPKNVSQKIIALLDRDKAGVTAVKEIIGTEEKIEGEDFNFKLYGNVHIMLLPVKKYYRGSKKCFLIEDYFRANKIKHLVFPKDYKSFATIANKENIKSVLASSCGEFTIQEFNGFRTLFDKILEIKNLVILGV